MLTLRTSAVAALIAAALVVSAACSKDKKGKDEPTGDTIDATAPATPVDAAADPKTASIDAGDPVPATDAGSTAAGDPIDAAPATKPPPDGKKKLTNIKALPKTWTYDQVEKYMKSFERALGEECEFCHDEDDYAADDNEHKEVAREMITMQNALNRKYFKGQQKITCYTCHLGEKEPK